MILQELCKVRSVEMLSEYICSMEIETQEMASGALVGQFVHIKCGDKAYLRRPISICDVYDNIIRIVFEIKGEGTTYLSKRVCSDTLDILGSIGRGYDLSKSGDSPVFVGGGIGVPPLLYACKTAKKEGKNVTAVLGFKNKDALILLKEFEEICDKVYVTTDDGSYGRHGFVSDVLKEIDYTASYACGPSGMLKAVIKDASDTYCEVSMEERMGCGIGACLVCACKVKSNDKDFDLKHVCKDGPVFVASEIVLD